MDMKAAVVKVPGKLAVCNIPVPEFGPYDVLCRMCYGATCAGTDIHLMDGKHPYPVNFPTVLGHESIGRVVEVGSRVRNFKIGDLISRVGCPACPSIGLGSNWGGFAEYGIAKDHWQMKRDMIPLSEWDRNRVNQIIHPEIDEKTAPMIITWRETLSYSKRIHVSSGLRVFIIGSGANALSFAAHACNLGAMVFVVGSPKRRFLFQQLSIAAFFDYHSDHLTDEIREDVHGAEFDILIDAVGNSSTANQLLPLLKQHAAVGVYGWNNRTAYGLNPFLAVHSFHVYADGYDEEETNAEVQAMILRGQLRADLWYDINRPVQLKNIHAAYQSLRMHEQLKYLIEL